MMRIKYCLAGAVCVAMMCLVLASPASAYTRYYGRLAGTGDWSGAGMMTNLEAAMETWDNWHWSGGLESQEPCTESWIMNPSTGAIAWLDSQADDDDLVYFHFGGHGGPAGSDDDGDDALTPVEGDELYGNYSGWHILDDEFADAFQTINGGRKLFLMETCWAEGIVGGTHDLQPGQDNLTVGWSSAEGQDSSYEFVATLKNACIKPGDVGFAPADFDENHIITLGEWLEYARIFRLQHGNEVGWDGGGADFPILYDNTAELDCEITGEEGDYLYEYTIANNSWQDHLGVFGIDFRDAVITDISAPDGWTYEVVGATVIWTPLSVDTYLGPASSLGGFVVGSPCGPREDESGWGCEFTGFDGDDALIMGQDYATTQIPLNVVIPEPAGILLLSFGIAGALGALPRRLRRNEANGA